jgi:hypothetical protein
MDSFFQGGDGNRLHHQSIEKTCQGDLDATSKGEMLTAMTAVEGSAGYVAMEQVFGHLDGKKGSFVLQHYGMMSGGTNRLVLEVVPDSGTDELAGLTGTMSIEMKLDGHYYVFEYELK